MKRWLVACAMLLLMALNSSAVADPTPPIPGPDQALVYIYRVPTFALAARGTTFEIDDVVVARMWQKHYTWALVPAGDHVLTQKWPIDITLFKKTRIEGRWEGGQTYYYQLTTGFSTGYNTMTFSWRLAQVPESTALTEMTKYRYQAALNADKIMAPTITSKMAAPAADH